MDSDQEVIRLKEEIASLKMHLHKYKTLFDVSGDALSIIDLETGKFIECNQSAIEMHGVESSENFIDLSPDQISPEFQLCGRASQEMAMEYIGKTVSDGPQLFEWTHSRLDGTTFPCLVSLTALPVADRQLVLAIGRNITEIVAAKAELAASLHELKTKQDKQARMFAVIGHELRTPLAAIKMMSDEMHIGDMQPYGQEILRSTDSLLSILDDLRIVANPDRIQEQKSVADKPLEVVARSVRSIDRILGESHMHAHLDGDSLSNSVCDLSAQSLGQITVNLVKNAAIHSGGSDVWITISSRPKHESLIEFKLRIEDNGCGIQGEKRNALYEAFRRGDSNADGTGLGLYITKELVELIAGDINYFDSAQGGAGFEIVFEACLATNFDREVSTELDLEGLTILLAEDQLTIQKLTSKQLSVAGAKVICANDGLEAIDKASAQEFDIVLTDITMPNMDGYQLTQYLRNAGFKGVIIGITAATMGSETEKLSAMGANAVLSKPIVLRDLKRLLYQLSAK